MPASEQFQNSLNCLLVRRENSTRSKKISHDVFKSDVLNHKIFDIWCWAEKRSIKSILHSEERKFRGRLRMNAKQKYFRQTFTSFSFELLVDFYGSRLINQLPH